MVQWLPGLIRKNIATLFSSSRAVVVKTRTFRVLDKMIARQPSILKLLSAILILMPTSNGVTTSLIYRRINIDTTAIVTSGSSVPSRGLLECLSTCHRTTACQSIFYLYDDQSCFLNDVAFDVTSFVTYLTAGPGRMTYAATPQSFTSTTTTTTTTTTAAPVLPTYGQPCNGPCQEDNSQCENNICSCLSNYGHDTCDQTCKDLGAAFTRYQGMSMDGHNQWKDESGIRLSECQRWCLSKSWCLSVEFGVNWCVIMETSMLTHPSDFLPNTFGDSYYHRICNQ